MERQDLPGNLAAIPAVRGTLELADSKPFCWAVRAGFVARGLTYAMIGGICVALAFGAGHGGNAPNQQGALSLVASAPLGRVIIAVAAVGLAAYALWKLFLGVVGVGPEGHRGHKIFDRVANLGGGVVYVAFCALTVQVLVGSASNQTVQQRQEASGVLHHWPLGPAWIAGAGIFFVAICLYQIYVGGRGTFANDCKIDDMGEHEHDSFMALGRIGLVSRALVFGLSGYFLIHTAFMEKVSPGIGVDGALAEVHGQPGGNILLVLVAIGLFIFAVFSFQEARRRRL